MPDDHPLGPPPRNEPSLAYVWTAVLGSFAVIALLRFAFEVRAVLVILLFGVLFSLLLAYPIELLTRFLPRWVATLITLCGVLGIGSAAAARSAPYFATQLQWLVDHLPSALEGTRHAWHELAPPGLRLTESWRQSLERELAGLLGKALPVAFSALSVFSSALAVLALALFLAHDGAEAKHALVRLVPTRHEATWAAFLDRAGSLLQRWMVGQLAAMTLTGLLTAVGLLMLGIQSWLVLGVITFVLEFVPYVGPFLALLPGLVAGFAVSPDMALRVVFVYMGVQLVESYVLQPLIMKRALRIRPAVQLIWQLAMAAAFGVLGIFVASPLLACLEVAVRHFYIEGRLGKPAVVSRQPGVGTTR